MKVLIVSGFLGAGKTTFIRELARRIEGTVVVLENEFGEVGVDGALLRDAPVEVVELAQGCICCTMRADFLQPIAEIDESGDFFISKVDGSGGLVNVDICREQLLYEIGDPSHYITPDGIADFSRVTFEQKGKDLVLARHASSRGLPKTWKVNVGYQDCWIGEASLSFGGSNAFSRARLVAEVVEKRLHLIGVVPDEYRVDYIGYSSLYGEGISAKFTPDPEGEIRLRVAARSRSKEVVTAVVREIECLYINGPAGSSGIASTVEQVLSVENILIPKEDVVTEIVWYEV